MDSNRVRIEPNHRRLRVLVDGVVIADTIESIYLFETGHLPVYYLPKNDIRFDLLEHTDRSTHCPYKGDAEYWSIVVGDRRIDDAVWSYPSPLPGAPDLSAYAAFYWNRVDNWFEEDEEVFVHARDPYKRVDALASSRHVEVHVNGETVADTTQPTLLFETGLPTRYYIPKIDVRMDLPGITAKDIDIQVNDAERRIDTYRASGAGGQHVNTTDSAVRITHIPTGIVVASQNDRSQHKNRAQAMKQLKARLYEAELQKREAEASATNAAKTDIGWGHQIRSYVLQPYQLVKDLRTGVTSTSPGDVLDGDLDRFMAAALSQRVTGETVEVEDVE